MFLYAFCQLRYCIRRKANSTTYHRYANKNSISSICLECILSCRRSSLVNSLLSLVNIIVNRFIATKPFGGSILFSITFILNPIVSVLLAKLQKVTQIICFFFSLKQIFALFVFNEYLCKSFGRGVQLVIFRKKEIR